MITEDAAGEVIDHGTLATYVPRRRPSSRSHSGRHLRHCDRLDVR